VPSSAFEEGGTARFAVKSGLNQRNRRVGLFHTILKFYTSRGGGIGGPNPPAGALGSPVKSSPNLFSRKVKDKEKSGVRIRPSLAGYGLGTRVRATLARTLIPGPATDPSLRIRSPGACLRSTDGGTFGLILHVLTDSFDLNFIP
jgi:hypothetical protein